MARKKFQSRLSKLSVLYKKYNSENPDKKLSWPPSKEQEKMLTKGKVISTRGRKSKRGELFREAKNMGYNIPYRNSSIKNLKNYIAFDGLLPKPNLSGIINITKLLSNKQLFRKYLLSLPFSKTIRYRLKLDDRYLTVNDKMLKRTSESYDQFDQFFADFSEGNNYGSDVDTVTENLNQYRTAALLADEIGDVKELPRGAFFPYKIDQNNKGSDEFKLFQSTLIRYANNDNDLDCLGYAISLAFPSYLDSYLIYRKTEPGTSLQRNRLSKLAKTIGLNIYFYKSTLEKNGYTRYSYKSDSELNPTINLSLLDNHYFIYEETQLTVGMLNKIAGIKRQVKGVHLNLSSLSFMKQIINKKLVIPLSYQECINKTLTFKLQLPIVTSSTPNIIEGHVEADKSIKKPMKEPLTIIPIYWDTETCPGRKGVFTLYQLSFSIKQSDGNFKEFTIDNRSGQFTEFQILSKFFNFIYKLHDSYKKQNKKVKFICIAHNLGFDGSFLLRFNHKGFHISSRIGNSSSNTKCLSASFYDCQIKFQDSYAFIATKLTKFTEMFDLKTEKAPFPYGAMTSKAVEENCLSIKVAKKHMKESDHNSFEEAIEPFLINKTHFKILDYSAYYCELDVKLLQQGFEIFRKGIIEQFKGIEVLDFISTPSLAKAILLLEPIYKTIPEVRGALREYINKTCVGGRTCLRDNKIQNCREKKIDDLDVTSLYPYAFTFLTNVPISAPKQCINIPSLTIYTSVDTLYKDLRLEEGTWLFCDINITSLKKPRHIPSLSKIDGEEQVRNWNDIIGLYTVNHIQLQDLCNFQEISFEFHGGIYYPKSSNDVSYKPFFEDLFKKRAEYKKQGNPIQETYKLLLNSQHGKMTQNPITSSENFKEVSDEVSEKKFDDFIMRNFQEIEEYRKLTPLEEGPTRYIIKKSKAVGDYSNQCQVASVMYAYSKRVLNEAIYLAEDNGISVYYTDTDSMFIDQDNLTILAKLYKEKYHRELLGKDLGFFHSDFPVVAEENTRPYASGIFMAKKSYFLKCNYIEKGTKEPRQHKIEKMKGIPQSAITEYYRANNTNHDELVMKLFNGEELEFDLSTNQVRFEINDNFQYKHNAKFLRFVFFSDNEEIIKKHKEQQKERTKKSTRDKRIKKKEQNTPLQE